MAGRLATGRRLEAEAPARLGEPVAIERVVGSAVEDALAAIAALRDMVGNAGNDDASDAGRASRAARRRKLVKTGAAP